ncbi:sulfonate transport system ATP-binding protein [Azomonas agilis]|uniref:Sulfonate transport system ATP-binding protein n=1 Tax=Azomonas agilis TaxID=116849 RepID=A0A562I1F6_9GAMM|nr:ABC transporter ATP-binding protein [Azomonas agilis]TWH64840.1 sulfonate transport system ATP-binding protein [Azomonas agilis]
MLELHHLSKTYANGTAALRQFNLSIQPGEAVAIVGGSGCGKSTLLRLISGLEQASSGSVVLNGETISAPHPEVGLVFQEPRLLPWLSVADNIGFGLDQLPKAERQTRVQEALARVGLAGQGNKWPRELSGGMAQRVALARALVSRPGVLLLDEPFSALDALTRSDLQDHLVELWQGSRPTLILVTHDIEEALVIADRVIVLRPKPGRLEAVIDISLSRPRIRDAEDFETVKRQLRAALEVSLQQTPQERVS